jgi:hypothetical protein
MMQPNWFDQGFDSDFVMSGATVEEKVDRALAEVAKSSKLRTELSIAILEFEKTSQMKGFTGNSLSQVVRETVSSVLSETP